MKIGNIVKIHTGWLTNQLDIIYNIGYIEKIFFTGEIYVENLSIIHEVYNNDDKINKATIKYSDCIQLAADVIVSNTLIPSIPLKFLLNPDESELIQYKLQEGDNYNNRKIIK
jgi:hypothetical protein